MVDDVVGYATEMAGDVEGAYGLYRRAHALSSNIPRLGRQHEPAAVDVKQQIVNVARQMQLGEPQGLKLRVPPRMQQNLSLLNGSGSVPQTEEALRCLGQYLGLESTRPDKEHGTGPDVLWMSDEGFALVMEVKTDKEKSSSYQKSDLGQLRDHVQWVTDRFGPRVVAQIFVGPLLPASESANPSPDMQVVNLGQFNDIGKRLLSTVQDVTENALPLRLIEELNEKMRARGLVWPDVYESIEKSPLIDR